MKEYKGRGRGARDEVNADTRLDIRKLLNFLGFLTFLFAVNTANAQFFKSTQPEKSETRNGNKQFEKENYPDAEASYKKALDIKNNMPEATFNLGDAQYGQKRYDEAAKQFQLSAQNNPDPKIKAKALHNLGNTYLEQRKYEDAVKFYKESLRWNANDKDTKYNLAYANAMIQRQKQQNQDDKNKNDKDKKDKKDKKDDKQNQQQKDKKPDSSNEDQQSKKDEQQKGPKPQLTRQEAEKLLQALQNEEQKTNQKMQQKQMKVVNGKIQKDW